MPDQDPHDHEPQSAADQLLEHSWEARERRASQRELLVETAKLTIHPRSIVGTSPSTSA
jgi:hypothetical protein